MVSYNYYIQSSLMCMHDIDRRGSYKKKYNIYLSGQDTRISQNNFCEKCNSLCSSMLDIVKILVGVADL